jgi:hypothetical protein
MIFTPALPERLTSNGIRRERATGSHVGKDGHRWKDMTLKNEWAEA